MDEADKKMVVAHIVEDIFIPEVVVVLHGFIAKFKEQVVFEHEYHKVTGYHLATPPVFLDLRHAEMHLTDSLATVFKEKQNVG